LQFVAVIIRVLLAVVAFSEGIYVDCSELRATI